MLDAADVLIDGHPVVGAIVELGRIGVCAGEAREVPRRLHERVEGVGVAMRMGTAPRAGGLHELGEPGQRRAAALDVHVLREKHRELLVGNRDHSA